MSHTLNQKKYISQESLSGNILPQEDIQNLHVNKNIEVGIIYIKNIFNTYIIKQDK